MSTGTDKKSFTWRNMIANALLVELGFNPFTCGNAECKCHSVDIPRERLPKHTKVSFTILLAEGGDDAYYERIKEEERSKTLQRLGMKS